MKNLLFLLLIVCLCFSCRNTKDDIIRQNNLIVADQLDFYTLNDSLFLLFEQETIENEYIRQYDTLVSFLKTTIAQYDTLVPAGGDDELIRAMQDFLSSYGELAYHEYRELLHIIIRPRYSFDSADLQKLDSLYSIVDRKQQIIDSTFAARHNAFSAKHGIQFSDND